MTTIGRSRKCSLRIEDESVSGLHARLELRGNRHWLIDESSTNGTYLNNRRIAEAVVSEGDVARFGDVEFLFDGAKLVPSKATIHRGESNEAVNRTWTQRFVRTPILVVLIAVLIGIAVMVWFVMGRSAVPSTLSLARATVVVAVLDGNEDVCAFGSGFVVGDTRTVATNHHVVESIVDTIPGEADCKTVVVGFSDESGLRMDSVEAARVLRFDKSADVALLEIVGNQGSEVKPMSIDKSEPRLGDAIRVFGYPAIGGESLTVTDGYLSGIEEGGSLPLFKTTSQIAGGNSGGPVVNNSGRVIGIAAARFIDVEEVESIGLIIPVRYLVDLIERGDLED